MCVLLQISTAAILPNIFRSANNTQSNRKNKRVPVFWNTVYKLPTSISTFLKFCIHCYPNVKYLHKKCARFVANGKQLTFVVQQEVERFVEVDAVATGCHVNIDGVRQRRMQVSATSISTAHSKRPRRSDPLRDHSVLEAHQTDVGGCPRRREVDQGDVDALAATDDDPPGAWRRRRGRGGGKTVVGVDCRRQRAVVGEKTAETVNQRRSIGRAASFHRNRHCHIAPRTTPPFVTTQILWRWKKIRCQGTSSSAVPHATTGRHSYVYHVTCPTKS